MPTDAGHPAGLNRGPARAPRRARWPFVTAGVVLAALAGLAAGEAFGWPFLAAPLQSLLSDRLQRRVSFGTDAAAPSVPAGAFSVRFIGGLRVQAPALEIAAPPWSKAPHLLQARAVSLELRYGDLWRATRGQPLRVQSLHATTLDGQLERLADGRVSWQFGPPPNPGDAAAAPVPWPSFGDLQVADGNLHYRDEQLDNDVQVRLSLVDAATLPVPPPARAGSAAAAIARAPGSVLKASASGHHRHRPLKIELLASGAMPWAADGTNPVAVPITLRGKVGHASFDFDGSAVDALRLKGLSGKFSLSGPSLAAVGDPLGVTLPTTAAFRTHGVVDRSDGSWSVRIDGATVGKSRLSGAFTYDTARSVPFLSGRLVGSRLALVDLGPVVGTTAVPPPASAASAPATAPVPVAVSARAPGKVLPRRPFDLAALRAMDADVSIDIREVDLDTTLLEPLRPLRGRLRLAAGVLTLRDLDARLGQGQLRGDLALDGTGSTALWTADLRWDGVRVERWIHQRRAEPSPPFVTGRLKGHTKLSGQGRSTAEILASLQGQARIELHEGAVSHLALEVAGLDLAEGLGVMIRGNAMLPVQCAVGELVAAAGVVRPRVMVLDTTDSTVWIEGTLSLAAETIDLRAVVSPKDFSPLALRTPLRLHGSLSDPTVSIEKGPMARKLAAAFLLALVNPLAAMIPFIDVGDADAARKGAAGCHELARRSVAGR